MYTTSINIKRFYNSSLQFSLGPLRLKELTPIISMYKLKWWVFLMARNYVLCEVRTESEL
jgi:hypothetical protein